MNGSVRTQPIVTPTGGLDGVIDISHLSLVTDFTLMRQDFIDKDKNEAIMGCKT